MSKRTWFLQAGFFFNLSQDVFDGTNSESLIKVTSIWLCFLANSSLGQSLDVHTQPVIPEYAYCE